MTGCLISNPLLFDDSNTHYMQTLNAIWNAIVTYALAIWNFFLNTPWLQALLAGLVAYGLAKLVSHFVPKGLQKLIEIIKFPVGEKIIDLFPSPIFFAIFIIGLDIATGLLHLTGGLDFTVQASLRSVLIFILSGFVLQLSKLLLKLAANNPNAFKVIQPQTLPLFSNLAVLLVVLAGIYITFTTWNVNMSALLASAGIVGLAIGMAARDTLSDIISGVLILTDSPYRVGDIVILEDGTRGRISSIGIRSTRLITIENFDVTIPNANIGSSKIINESSNEAEGRLIAVDVGLPYGLDVDMVRQELLELAQENQHVLEKPASAVRIMELDRERLQCRLSAWVDSPANRFLVEFALNEAVYKRFAEAGIPIYKPQENAVHVREFPHQAAQEIHIKEMPQNTQEIHIKEMPSLFGQNSSAGLTSPSLSKPPLSSTSPRQKASDLLLKNTVNQAKAKKQGTKIGSTHKTAKLPSRKPVIPQTAIPKEKAHIEKNSSPKASSTPSHPSPKKPVTSKPLQGGAMDHDDDGMMDGDDGGGE